ncbi:MAG: hypothetical protein GC168_15180 [Candidatus Hydrogenedens sp.]|nr:hypothetical protein [Candidatus Hydrogenedens sp.]
MSGEAPKKRLRYRWLLYALAGLLVLLVLLFGVLQTGPVLRMVEQQLEARSGGMVQVRGLGGFVPFNLHADSIAITDPEGAWLDIQEARLSLSAGALLGGRVRVQELAAASVNVARSPAYPPSAEPVETVIALPELPPLPAWLSVDAIDIERVVISDALLPETTAIKVAGAYDTGQSPPIRMTLEGQDGAAIEASINAGWAGKEIDADIDLTDGAVLPKLLGLEGPLAVKLALAGPREAAKVSFESTLNGSPLAELNGMLGLDAPMKTNLNGTVNLPEMLMPEAARGNLGDALSLTVDASVDEAGNATIALARVQSDLLRVEAKGEVASSPMKADLTVEAYYEDLYRFSAERPAEQMLALETTAEISGTLDALTITLGAKLNGEAWLQGQTTLALADTMTAAGESKLLPAGDLLPAEIAALLQDGADASFDIAVAGGAVSISKLNADLASARVTASGTLDYAKGLADLTLAAGAEDLDAFSALAGQPLAGGIQLDASVQGDGTKTTITAKVQGDGLQMDTLRAPKADIDATITAGPIQDDLAKSLAVTMTAALPGLELQPGLARDLKVDTSLTLEDLKRLEVAHLNADDGNLTANASGVIDLTSRRADFEASINVADLAAYAAPLGYPYGGALELSATVISGETDGTLNATAQGKASELSGLPEGTGDALGEGVTFSARGAYDGTVVQLDDLLLSGGSIDAQGSGRYGLEDENLAAKLNATVGDLAALQAIAGRPLSGKTTLAAEVSGTLSDLSAKGTVEAEGLVADPVRADAARVAFDAQQVTGDVQASASASMERDGATLNAAVAISRAASVITVSELKLDAGKNQATGSGTWNLDTQRGSGRLKADLPALAALRTWLELPLEGAAAIDARLADSGEALDATFSASDLVVPGVSVASAQGSAALESLFDTPAGKIDITATDLRASDLEIASLALKADGPASAMRFDVQTEGVYQQALPFSIAATGEAGAEPQHVDLDTLAAKLDTQEITLAGAASARVEDGSYTLTPLRLEVAGGTFTLEGAMDGKQVNARASWSDLPLALAALAGQQPYLGSASGAAEITGPVDAPEATATLAIVGLRIPDEDGDTRGIDANLEAKLGGGRASATLEAGIPDALQLNCGIAAPASLSLSPWTFDAPASGALDGRITGDGQLASVPELLGIEGHDLQGALKADVGIGGTVGAPVLNGGVDITEGYYENHTTGTILDKLTVRLEADGNDFRLAKFEAVDGTGGSIEATGAFALEEAMPFQVDATLSNMRLAHRDDVSARAGGTIAVRGDSTGAKVEGDVQAGPATINLPERLPAQQITTVDFRMAGEESASKEAEETPPAYPVALDVRCNIPGRIWVNGPGLESEWAGDLVVTGTAQEPALRGTLRVRNGNLMFLGRDFDLGESTISFSGQSPPSPALNILAVSQTKEITARVRLEGELESLNITLESDPPLPQDEVLSQVLFGSSLSEVTPFQALQLARYAPLFSSRVSGLGLLGGSGTKAPAMLDRISLQSGAGIADTTVTAGKSLGDDLYLEFEQGAGTKSTAVSLEWLFAPNWSLEGKTGANAEGGAGIFWKKDY